MNWFLLSLSLVLRGQDIECSPQCPTDKKSKEEGRKGREIVFWIGNRCDISKSGWVSGWSDPRYQVTRHRVEVLLLGIQCHQSRPCWQHWLPLKNILKRKGQNHLFLRVNEFTKSWLLVPRRLSTNPDDCSKSSGTSSRQRKTFEGKFPRSEFPDSAASSNRADPCAVAWGIWLDGWKFESWFSPLLALWPWAYYLTSLYLSLM